jgi:hypothetical protein
MIRISIMAPLLVLLVAASGCSSLQDHIVDCEMDLRNQILAQKGWNEWSWCYDELDYPFHFAKGFKAGYRDILSGGNGCQPTLPPRCYWKPKFQSPEGRCKTNAWFDGFSHGALAAQQDGFGNLNEIPMSPTARANMIACEAPVSAEAWNQMYHDPQPVPDSVPAAATSGEGTDQMGVPAIPVPPDVEGSELAIPVRPYDE